MQNGGITDDPGWPVVPCVLQRVYRGASHLTSLTAPTGQCNRASLTGTNSHTSPTTTVNQPGTKRVIKNSNKRLTWKETQFPCHDPRGIELW